VRIALLFFHAVDVPAWNVVQFLILYVFVKYGNPLQQDAGVLITNKLQAI